MFSNVKLRPTLLIIATGLVVALVLAVWKGAWEVVDALSVALAGTLAKMAESEEKTINGGS